MNDTIKQFVHYIDEMALAECRRNIRKMRKCLQQAEQLPVVNEFQRWTLEYSKAIYQLLYDQKADQKIVCQKLLELRKEAKTSPILLTQVQEMYIRLHMHLLQKNYIEMEAFAEYEELALELLEIIEKKGEVIQEMQDLYAFANHVLGNCYERMGRIRLAAKYYNKIWEKALTVEFLSKYSFSALIYLVNNLCFQGNLERAYEVGVFLWDKLFKEKVRQPYPTDIERYIVTFCVLLDFMNRKDLAFKLVQDSLDTKFTLKSWKQDNLIMIYSIYLYELLFHKKSCPKKTLRDIEKCFRRYEKNRNFFHLSPWNRSNFYKARYYLEIAKTNTYQAEYLDKCMQILTEEEFGEMDRMPYLNAMIFVIQEYKSMGNIQRVSECTEQFMHQILNYYSMTEYYAENEKLERYMGVCKLGFQIAYLTVSDTTDLPKRMEYSMNFKNVLSTVINRRNQLMRDDWWIREKKAGTISYFSIQELSHRMLDNTAVIEYIYTDLEVYRSNATYLNKKSGKRMLEIFGLIKQNDRSQFMYKKIEDDTELNLYIRQFLERMKLSGGKLNKLSGSIYDYILKPFEENLKTVKHLWICPDQDLCNIPFDVILDMAQREWAYQDIVHWKSLRDIFEKWEFQNTGIGLACSIGDPEFLLKNTSENRKEYPKKRWIEQQIVPLPFSGYEVKKIAAMLKSIYYTAQKATKYEVRSGYRYLHIATHGICQEDKRNVWYESSLAFSGIVDYAQSGKEGDVYGNGLLTAEEISRMNLSGTEMVVLSACNSGNSLFSDFQEQTGLHVAFGAAGVKYVVSALWEVDDLAAAIYMFYFYENIINGWNIPIALHRAGFQLRNTTVEKVKNMIAEDEKRLRIAAIKVSSKLKHLPEDYLLYKSPKYWGSFVCYQYLN